MSVSIRVANRRRLRAPELAALSVKRLAFLLVVATLSALFYAYASVETRGLAYQASRQLEAQRQLREEARELKVELNLLRSPARLEREGLRLGLKPPGPDQVRQLK